MRKSTGLMMIMVVALVFALMPMAPHVGAQESQPAELVETIDGFKIAPGYEVEVYAEGIDDPVGLCTNPING